jgi:hypothetical protein
MNVLKTSSTFPGCHIGFDYVRQQEIPVDSLLE